MFENVLDTSLIITSGKLIPLDKHSLPEYIDGYKDYIKWINYNDFVKEDKQGKVMVYFPVNSNREIKNKAIHSYLDELVAKLNEHPAYKVVITGYTDNTGNAQKNIRLGMSRAKRIRDVLISKGIDAGRIITKSEGENNPIADNHTAEGRQKNRRVEISLKNNHYEHIS
jgi:outer membrane protein OmpA-like peptidoglycan-associated protein